MAEGPIDLIRWEGDGSSVVVRITAEGGGDGLNGEFDVETPFVRGSLRTSMSLEDLRAWQQALDLLDTGHDIAWRADTRAPGLFVELAEDDDRCRVTVKDDATSPTTVTVTVPMTDAWFDDAYHRLDRAFEVLRPNEG
ncbi:DUF5959 family protein [Streptomyces sp. PLK6-54]|uniref:DUF5959 family protein n=2 Tax=Actinacidiphila acidipaludis TaxID=2873382 RepID=A0ABS7QF99_9ACTN|nr:DUF5959 family protein [Streptomyces acidipaludis]